MPLAVSRPPSTPTRCWRCFHPRAEDGTDCALCGAPATPPATAGPAEASTGGAPQEDGAAEPTAGAAPEAPRAPPAGGDDTDAASQDEPVAAAAYEDEARGGSPRDHQADADREPDSEADADDGEPALGPDLSSVDDLWAEDHVVARRRRRRAVVLLAAAVALVAVAVATVLAVGKSTRSPGTASPSTATEPQGPPADPGALAAIRGFGHGLHAHAAGLAVSDCTELARGRELRCTFRSGRQVAVATFHVLHNVDEGEAMLETRLTGATDISRVLRPDGEAATFRLALGGTGAQQLPWVAWYAGTQALYAEVWTGDADFLVATAIDGEIGFLPGHAPLLEALYVGRLSVETGGCKD